MPRSPHKNHPKIIIKYYKQNGFIKSNIGHQMQKRPSLVLMAKQERGRRIILTASIVNFAFWLNEGYFLKAYNTDVILIFYYPWDAENKAYRFLNSWRWPGQHEQSTIFHLVVLGSYFSSCSRLLSIGFIQRFP